MASCIGLSTRRMCLLLHQTGLQYSAAEWIKARAAVRNVLVSELHLELDSCLKSPTRAVKIYSMILLDVDGMYETCPILFLDK